MVQDILNYEYIFSGNSIKLPKQIGRKNQLGNQFIQAWANGSSCINGYEKEN